MRRTATTMLGLVAVSALALSGCSTETASSSGITIVASTNVWGSVAEAVAGNLATVTSLINDPSADPHSYEASPADAANVSKASLVVYNGGGYDSFFTDILKSEGAGKPTVDAFELNTASGADKNEHVWYDAATADATADSIAAELGKIDPTNASTFTANAATFKDQMKAVTDITSKVAADHAGTPVAQTEPIAHYLLDAAKLDDKTPEDFKDAIEEGNDPSPASIAETRDLFTNKTVKLLAYNIQTQDNVTQAIRTASESAGIPVLEVTETLPSGMNYVQWQTSVAQNLEKALDSGKL